MVRGFWGDVQISPFVSFGVEIANDKDREMFEKKVNFQSVYHASDAAMYNVQNYIYKLEDEKEFVFPFERFKHIDKAQKEEEKKEELP